MKKVLLLNPTFNRPIMRDTFHPTSKSALYIWHPLDILIHSGYLTGFDIRVYDGVVNNNPANLHRLLEDFKPDGVLSLIAFPTLKSDVRLLEHIKSKYGSVIWGVGDVTYGEKEKLLEQVSVLDGILPDYTSKGFAQFMRGESPKNAIWRDGGKIVSETTHEPLDWDVPRHDLLDLSKYYLPYWKPPFGSIYATHGCPAKCRFCVVPGWGPTRFREHEAILDELDFLRSLGVRKVFFRDGSFNQWPKYTISLMEKIASRFPKTFRFTTWFKPKPLSDEMAEAMSDAGFQYVHIGVETGSPEFLHSIGKDFEVKDVEPGIEILHRHNIKVVGHFMLALPGETKRDQDMTATFLKKTQLDVVSFSIFEFSFGIMMKRGQEAPITFSDKQIKWELLRQYSKFYFRPDRWSKIYFFEDFGHLLQTIPRALRYLFDLRLYPRFKALE